MNIDQFDNFVEDLLGENLPRPIIIVGASKIDDLLYLILSKFLIEPINASDEDLIKGDNPLSTFSSRIKVCYRLGIIDESLFKILNQVRKIRNECAHSIEFDIKKSPIKDHLRNLRAFLTIRKSFSLTKMRYFNNIFSKDFHELQCLLVTICVILEAIYDKISKTEGFEWILKISIK